MSKMTSPVCVTFIPICRYGVKSLDVDTYTVHDNLNYRPIHGPMIDIGKTEQIRCPYETRGHRRLVKVGTSLPGVKESTSTVARCCLFCLF